MRRSHEFGLLPKLLCGSSTLPTKRLVLANLITAIRASHSHAKSSSCLHHLTCTLALFDSTLPAFIIAYLALYGYPFRG